jgi:hyperosmotically inducible protein
MTGVKRIDDLATIAIGLSLVMTLTGCPTLLVETGKKALEDRTTNDQVTDTKLAASITTDLTKKDKSLLLDVSTDVWEQRVLLTGAVSDSLVKQEIVAMVRADERVRTVYDEIQIVSPEEQAERRKAV